MQIIAIFNFTKKTYSFIVKDKKYEKLKVLLFL